MQAIKSIRHLCNSRSQDDHLMVFHFSHFVPVKFGGASNTDNRWWDGYIEESGKGMRCRGTSHGWYLPSTNTLSEDGERICGSDWIFRSESRTKTRTLFTILLHTLFIYLFIFKVTCNLFNVLSKYSRI